MMHRHTIYETPRGVAGKRREPIYYSNMRPFGNDQVRDYSPVPEPKRARRRRERENRER